MVVLMVDAVVCRCKTGIVHVRIAVEIMHHGIQHLLSVIQKAAGFVAQRNAEKMCRRMIAQNPKQLFGGFSFTWIHPWGELQMATPVRHAVMYVCLYYVSCCAQICTGSRPLWETHG